MKNIIKYFAAVGAGCLLMTSCDNDEFLTTTQYDILSIDAQFENDNNALLGLNGIYTFNNVTTYDNSWGFKPNLFTGSHPTMDTQCTGWDVKFLDQTWDANVGELGEGWSHAYAAISRANLYLQGIADVTTLSDACKRTCIAEGKALRAYFYMWLAETFGRVPMLATGEDFSNTPVKAAADTYEEMWDFIIADLVDAVNGLDWAPYQGQYGRCTKGMAKAYLADAYMWKAYRCPDQAATLYQSAKKELKEIIDSNTYELSSNFSTNWDPKGFWNKECIWAMVSDEGNLWSDWGADRTITFCNPNMFKWFTACPDNGGWGAMFVSWEAYANYEKGDQRRDASMVTGNVDEKLMAQYGIEKSPNAGYNVYLKDSVGTKDDAGVVVASSTTKHFHYGTGELAPSIWSAKWWRTAFADGADSWGAAMWAPNIVYSKRYANVLLDYAECCFRTGEEAEGWAQIDAIRNRAWGNLEVGKSYDEYLVHYNTLYSTVSLGAGKTMTEYPLPVLTEPVEVPAAKEFYTALQAKPNRVGTMHTSEAWKVAVNEERRKEFNCEWSLCPDLIRSGYIEDHINYNYPVDQTSGDALRDYPWSHRVYTYDKEKMDMPIPAIELLKNTALKQNPAYLSK